MSRQRLLVPAAVAVTAVAVITSAVLYTAACSSLGAHGPNVAGYDLLLLANRSVVVDAVVLSAVGLLLVVVRGSRLAAWALVTGAAVTATAGAGAAAVGQALSAIRPTAQPLDLSSLLLALQGSGQDVLPAAVVFATAATASCAIVVVRGRRLARPAAV